MQGPLFSAAQLHLFPLTVPPVASPGVAGTHIPLETLQSVLGGTGEVSPGWAGWLGVSWAQHR